MRMAARKPALMPLRLGSAQHEGETVMARETGELVDWNDDRGYGFALSERGERYFVHIKSIERIATRPRVGDRLSFTHGVGRDGRPAAVNVKILGANPLPSRAVRERGNPASTPRPAFGWRLATAGVLSALLLIALLLDHAPLWLGLAYLIMGIISACLYAADKRYAETGQWRISEAMLLATDLGFGIIGGLLAQQVFRHKTAKQSYIGSTMLLCFVHILWLGGLAGGWIEPAAVTDLVSESIR